MRRNRQGRKNPVQNSRRQTCNHHPYRLRNNRNDTERSEQVESQTSQDAGVSETAVPSTSSDTRQNSQAPEFPGFYYDPEKNRYFRLLPGHNNCNPLTKESIRHKKMERQRLRLLEEEKNCMKKASRPGLNSTIILHKRQIGLFSSINYHRLVHELKVNCMQRKKIEIKSPDSSVSGSNNFKMIVADSAYERMVAVNDVENGGCKYGIVDLSGLGKDSPAVEMYDIHFTTRKVNSACWASLSHPDSHVLLCLMGVAETLGCASLLPASLFSNSNTGDQPGVLCSFKISTAWSCAWCLNPQADNCFSAGLSRRVLVINAVTGHRQTLVTSSDVVAQQFATQAPVLYNGCRSGEVFSIDLRVHSRKGNSWKAVRLFHHSAVSSIKLMKNENYLLFSDMEGQIKVCDLRKVKCVKEYKGHYNEHAIIPLHVNEEDGLLTVVGQDCYTRIWDLQNASLLRTIPSPYPSSRDSMPSVVLSSHLGGARGVPGLLMAVKEDLYHFSYKTDYPYCLHTKEMDQASYLSA